MELTKRMVVGLTVGTLLLLLYVHEQVSILQVSYSIGRKEREAVRLSEDYKTAKFRVARLRSPQALGQRLNELSLDLIIPTNQEVVTILKPVAPSVEVEPGWPAPVRFASWLPFVKEAQAKTSK